MTERKYPRDAIDRVLCKKLVGLDHDVIIRAITLYEYEQRVEAAYAYAAKLAAERGLS